MIPCRLCGVKQPRAGFRKDKNRPNGIRSECLACHRKHELRSRTKQFEQDPWSYIWRIKEYGAGRGGLVFTITLEWVKENAGTGCPYTGLAWIFNPPSSEGPRRGITALHDQAPTFDQIIPGAGYTPENTEIISWWANRAKGKQSRQEFRDYLTMCWEHTGGVW